MGFQAGNLMAGDELIGAQVNYNRSDGYDLSDFTVTR